MKMTNNTHLSSSPSYSHDMSFVPPTHPHPMPADFNFYFNNLHPLLTNLLYHNDTTIYLAYLCTACLAGANAAWISHQWTNIEATQQDATHPLPSLHQIINPD